jgi:hypothetical protein
MLVSMGDNLESVSIVLVNLEGGEVGVIVKGFGDDAEVKRDTVLPGKADNLTQQTSLLAAKSDVIEAETERNGSVGSKRRRAEVLGAQERRCRVTRSGLGRRCESHGGQGNSGHRRKRNGKSEYCPRPDGSKGSSHVPLTSSLGRIATEMLGTFRASDSA